MSIGLTIKVLTKGLEFYWGREGTKWPLLEVSVTAFTFNLALSVKV